MQDTSFEVAIIGAGIVGIATAYYLARHEGITRTVLIDRDPPMSFTSAQSGENYRNWWPHPNMVALTDRSIDLMEAIARESKNAINMTRRGYVLATRASEINDIVRRLHDGLQTDAERLIRHHDDARGAHYRRAVGAAWEEAPVGVDILSNSELIQGVFPCFDREVRHIIHIRRGGDISGQQLGQFMLTTLQDTGLKRLNGDVVEISTTDGFLIDVRSPHDAKRIRADRLVNAGGPYLTQIAKMIGIELPAFNVFQQKLAFDDQAGVIPRSQPFSIDLDAQYIDWTNEEREVLSANGDAARFASAMPGAVHCRPDGGALGTWVKLGWAYNETVSEPSSTPPLDANFPEIVLRGAARLNPALRSYYGRLPRNCHHYGGWYTMTVENWPLIGPMGPDGAFMNGAHSGFGTMSACAAGELCAAWIADSERPHFANDFSLHRYEDRAMMDALLEADRGIL